MKPSKLYFNRSTAKATAYPSHESFQTRLLFLFRNSTRVGCTAPVERTHSHRARSASKESGRVPFHHSIAEARRAKTTVRPLPSPLLVRLFLSKRVAWSILDCRVERVDSSTVRCASTEDHQPHPLLCSQHLLKGPVEVALHFVHRATTVLSWGLCEQGVHLSAPERLIFLCPRSGFPLEAIIFPAITSPGIEDIHHPLELAGQFRHRSQ